MADNNLFAELSKRFGYLVPEVEGAAVQAAETVAEGVAAKVAPVAEQAAGNAAEKALAPVIAKATQVVYPWRAVLRTVIQVIAALAVAVPGVIVASGVDQTVGWVAAALAVSAVVTRVMANPVVDAVLGKVGLGAQPKPS